jgi:hypothetical protein
VHGHARRPHVGKDGQREDEGAQETLQARRQAHQAEQAGDAQDAQHVAHAAHVEHGGEDAASHQHRVKPVGPRPDVLLPAQPHQLGHHLQAKQGGEDGVGDLLRGLPLRLDLRVVLQRHERAIQQDQGDHAALERGVLHGVEHGASHTGDPRRARLGGAQQQGRPGPARLAVGG